MAQIRIGARNRLQSLTGGVSRNMAENERVVRESRRGKYKREQPTELAYHRQVIHLTSTSGERVLYNFRPHAVRRDNRTDHVYASAELFGRIYKVRMMDKMPAWRVCDEKGNYLNTIFPEVDYLAKRQNTTNSEEVVAPPHSWGLD